MSNAGPIVPRREALLVGVGAVGLAAALSSRAQANTPFTTFGYPVSSGGTPITNAVNRTTPDRFGDVLNVRDFGALGDNTQDDAPFIQKCFDAAFGPAGSPNGQLNAIKNKAVYLPGGQYKLLSTLMLNQVNGGHIFGDSTQATILSSASGLSTDSVIRTNGCQYTTFERLGFGISSGVLVGIAFDLDMQNGSSVNVQSNTFKECNFGGGAIGCAINRSLAGGSQGSENTFINCFFLGVPGNTTFSGLKIIGQNALANRVFGGDFQDCNIGIDCQGGSCPLIHAVSFQNQQQPGRWDISSTTSNPDDYSIVGCRSETPNFAKLLNGANVHIGGCTAWATGGTFLWSEGGAVVEGCHVGGGFQGNMQVALINNLYNTANPLSGFLGLVTQFSGAPFTATSAGARSVVSLLPDPTRCSGCSYYVVDSSVGITNNTNIGATVAASSTIASFTGSCNSGVIGQPGTNLTVSSGTGIAPGQIISWAGATPASPGTVIISGSGLNWTVFPANLAVAGTAMTTAAANTVPVWCDGTNWRIG